VERRIRFVRCPLFDYMLKEAVTVGVHLDHTAQGRCGKSGLFPVRHNANCFFNVWDFAG
jgi:hypothetical protein